MVDMSGPSASQALHPSAPGQYDQIAFMNNTFYDYQTGALITQAIIMDNLKKLDQVQDKLEKSSKVYKQVMKDLWRNSPHMPDISNPTRRGCEEALHPEA